MDIIPINCANNWSVDDENKIAESYPIHRACRDNDTSYLQLLFDYSKEAFCEQIYNEDIFYKWTPFHWATYFGKPECMKFLLERSPLGAPHMLNLPCSNNKQTPLHIAAFLGDAPAVEWMANNGAILDAQDYLCETALHKAARAGKTMVIQILLKYGAKPNIRNQLNLTPAIIARNCNHPALAIDLEKIEKSLEPNVNPAFLTSGSYYHGYQTATIPQSPPMIEEAASLGRDITLSQDFLLDRVPVAGRKRRRDDDEEPVSKKRRTNDDTSIIPVTMFMTSEELAEHNSTCDSNVEMESVPDFSKPVIASSGRSSLPIPICASDSFTVTCARRRMMMY